MGNAKDKGLVRYEYLVGLCAYMRQAALSIDRARWAGWNELAAFYSARSNERYVPEYFIKLSNSLNLIPQYHEPFNNNKVTELMKTIFLFRRRYFLTLNEIESIHYLIDEFQELLSL